MKKILENKLIHNDEYYYQIVRFNVKRIRKERGLTQQELADLTGISRDYICDCENDSRNKHVSIALLGRIADALEVSMMEMFDDTKMIR